MFASIARIAVRSLPTGKLTLAAMAIFAAVHGQTAPASANDVVRIAAEKNTSIKVARGKPRTIRVERPFYEIVIGDPDVANVNPLTDRSFYVLGTNLGTTGIALFDENKQLVASLDVEVTLDTGQLASTIRQSVPGADIKVESANGRLVLSGSAENSVAAEKARNIASRFSGDEEIINSVEISTSQQVQLNVRFVEINRQVGQELGTQIGASYVAPGAGIGFNQPSGTGTTSPVSQIISSFATGGFSIDVAIKALEDRGVARRLAEPNLIARSGQKASFLAGGEFPIPVAGGDDTVTIEYKRYGVSLEFTPTVLADGLVSLDIEPEVSSIDSSASYQVGNISVPGFVVRRAQTSVDLKNGQSFMIAGLLQSQNDMVSNGVPGLKRLPVLGALFSSKAYQRRETDLVIIVTPYLVKPIDPSKKVATPADSTRPASAADYFLGNVEEVKAAARARRGVVTTVGHYLELQ